MRSTLIRSTRINLAVDCRFDVFCKSLIREKAAAKADCCREQPSSQASKELLSSLPSVFAILSCFPRKHSLRPDTNSLSKVWQFASCHDGWRRQLMTLKLTSADTILIPKLLSKLLSKLSNSRANCRCQMSKVVIHWRYLFAGVRYK